MNTSQTLMESSEIINLRLKKHQADASDWRFRRLAEDIHRWADRMIMEFKLETGTPALKIATLRRRWGHYWRGRNAFGLNDEIAIDERHAVESPQWQRLGTLLNELLHAWQEHSGKPPGPNSHGYHNKEFREKAEGLGLVVDQRGYTRYTPGDTPFLNLLRKYGVEVPDLPADEEEGQDEPPVLLNSSKLKLWQCQCPVRVRVAVADFNARCLNCGSMFKKQQ